MWIKRVPGGLEYLGTMLESSKMGVEMAYYSLVIMHALWSSGDMC